MTETVADPELEKMNSPEGLICASSNDGRNRVALESVSRNLIWFLS